MKYYFLYFSIGFIIKPIADKVSKITYIFQGNIMKIIFKNNLLKLMLVVGYQIQL